VQIPVETHRVHVPWSDLRCDTVALLDLTGREGRRFVDLNACHSSDGVSFNLHWGNGPRLNHYTWIWTGRRTRFLRREIRRPMTEAEIRRDTDEWPAAAILRWRRGKRGGPRPATVARRQAQAARRGVIPCWELKSHDYGQGDYAERFVADVEAAGGQAFYMTLVTMPHWGPKLRAFHQAGGQTALLAHGAPRPPDLTQWRPFIDRIWGHFA